MNPNQPRHTSYNRREFLLQGGKACLAAGLMAGGAPDLLAAARRKRKIEFPKGKAEHCIFIWHRKSQYFFTVINEISYCKIIRTCLSHF